MPDGVLHHFHEEDDPDVGRLTEFAPWVLSRMHRVMYGSDAVLAAAVAPSNDMPDDGGIYFLIWDEKIVYVGQAKSIYARIRQHMAEKLFIDRVAYVCGIPRWWRTEIEHAYIEAWSPPWNAETRRRGSLRHLPELRSLAASLDKSAVSEWRTPVMEPHSARLSWPSWKQHVLGCLQHRHPGDTITIPAWD